MNYQNLFSDKTKKNISKCLLKFLPRVLRDIPFDFMGWEAGGVGIDIFRPENFFSSKM